MTPLEDFIGQDRAIRAIEFGLGVNKPGFNIFVTGLTGTGKTSIIKAFLKKSHHRPWSSERRRGHARGLVLRLQFCRCRPSAGLKIRRGWGKVLKSDMEQLVQHLQREAKKMFESDDYAHQRQGTLVEQIQKHQQEMMEGLMAEARPKWL